MSPISLPEDGKSSRTIYVEEKIVHTHKTGSIMGLVIGGLIAFGGIFLILFGLAGSIQWLVNAGGISSKLINASPGVVIVVVGMIIIILYKPRVRYEYEIKRTPKTYYERGSGSASSPL